MTAADRDYEQRNRNVVTCAKCKASLHQEVRGRPPYQLAEGVLTIDLSVFTSYTLVETARFCPNCAPVVLDGLLELGIGEVLITARKQAEERAKRPRLPELVEAVSRMLGCTCSRVPEPLIHPSGFCPRPANEPVCTCGHLVGCPQRIQPRDL